MASISEETGNRIKNARKTAGLTQEELGRKLNISASSIAQYESGYRNPKLTTLQRIADALGIPVSTLRPVKRGFSLDEFEKSLNSYSDNIHHGFNIGDYLAKIEEAKKRPITIDLDYLHLLLRQLTPTGQEEAVKRVQELTELSRYRREDENPADNPEK